MADAGGIDIEIHGAEGFLSLSKALKEAGRVDLRKDLHKALRDETKPAIKKTQDALAAAVPARLAARAGKTKQVAVVATGRDPGVRIVVRYARRGGGLGASNARLLNRGQGIRHPLFGNRDHWYTTEVPAAGGWFDRTLEETAPRIRRGLESAMNTTINRIAAEGRHHG